MILAAKAFPASLALVAMLASEMALAAGDDNVEKLVADVVAGFALAGRSDVSACLLADATAHPVRRDEVARLSTIVTWIETAIAEPRRSGNAGKVALAKARSEAFAEIVASFNHERRIDTALLARMSDGRLEPRHISAFARVTRALAAGHDPKRIFCGE